MNKIKSVIFDWNGVIVDSFKLDHFLFLNSSKDLGVKVNKSKKFYKTLYQGNIFEKLLKIGFPENYLKNEEDYKRIYKKNLYMSKTFPNIRQVLLELRKKYRISLITANYSDIVNLWIKRDKFNEIFDCILTSDDSRNKNKNIDTFLNRYKIKKEEALYIGDTIADIAVCRDSGIKIIVATWGYHNEKELKKYNPDFIARKPEDLLKILGELDE